MRCRTNLLPLEKAGALVAPTAPDVRPPMVWILSDQECRERLAASSVARVGFVTGQGLQIIPLNYRTAGSAITLSTTPNGSLSQLAEMGAALTLEVDEHDDAAGLVWSVMVQGTVTKAPRGQAGASAPEPVDSWPGAQFSEALTFTPRTYSGRVLQHPGGDGQPARSPSPAPPSR